MTTAALPPLPQYPRRCSRAARTGVAILLTLLASTSCATVRSRKVASDGSFVGREGIPYYLPRPYLAVKQPFPVYGADFLAQGEVDAEGHVTVDAATLPEALRNYLATASTDPKRSHVPGSALRLHSSDATPDKGKKEDDDATKKDEDGEEGGEEAGGEEKEEPEEKTDAGSEIDAKGTTSPLVPISEVFDVIFLPDFEEKYVIRLRPRMGKLAATIGLNGGMLGGLAVNLDNTAIASMVTKSVETATDVAKEITLGKLLPAGDAAEEVNKLQSAAEEEKKPQRVTLRVRYAAEALPGLYPILKPGEQCPAKDAKEPASKNEVQMGCDGVASRRMGTELAVPLAPYTRIAYRVRHTLLVELITATASSEGKGSEPSGKGPCTDVAVDELKAWLTSSGAATGLKLESAERCGVRLHLRFKKIGEQKSKDLARTLTGKLDSLGLAKSPNLTEVVVEEAG